MSLRKSRTMILILSLSVILIFIASPLKVSAVETDWQTRYEELLVQYNNLMAQYNELQAQTNTNGERTTIIAPAVNTVPSSSGTTIQLRTSDNQNYTVGTTSSSIPNNTNKAVVVDVVDVVTDNSIANELNLKLSDNTISSNTRYVDGDTLVYTTDNNGQFIEDDIVLVTTDGSYIVGDNVITHEDIEAPVADDQNFLLDTRSVDKDVNNTAVTEEKEISDDTVELTEGLEDMNLIAETPTVTQTEAEKVTETPQEKTSFFKNAWKNIVGAFTTAYAKFILWSTFLSIRQQKLLIGIGAMIVTLTILAIIFVKFAKKNGMLMYKNNGKTDEDIIDDEQLDEAFAIN